jgi:hypothetical protein
MEVVPAGVNNERASITTSWPLLRAVVGFAPYDKSVIRTVLQEGGRGKRVTHTDFVRIVFQYSKFLEVERKMQSLWMEFFCGLIAFAIAFMMRKSACAWRLSVMRRRSPGRGRGASDVLSIVEPVAECRREEGKEGMTAIADDAFPY